MFYFVCLNVFVFPNMVNSKLSPISREGAKMKRNRFFMYCSCFSSRAEELIRRSKIFIHFLLGLETDKRSPQTKSSQSKWREKKCNVPKHIAPAYIPTARAIN